VILIVPYKVHNHYDQQKLKTNEVKNKMTWEKQEGNMDFWNPAEGEELIGEVKELVAGNYGLQIQVLKEDKTVVTTPSHKVLQAKLSKIKVGDKVKIVYVKQDLPKIKGQNGVKLYEVFIDKVEEKVE